MVDVTRYDLTLTTSRTLAENDGALPYSASWTNEGRTDLEEGNYENC